MNMKVIGKWSPNFDLDPDAIEMRSISKWNVELPYTGPLPEGYQDATAWISFDTSATCRKVLLMVQMVGEKKRPVSGWPIQISDKDLDAFLKPYFFKPNGYQRSPKDTGLSPHGQGSCIADYVEWRKLCYAPHITEVFKYRPEAWQADALEAILSMYLPITSGPDEAPAPDTMKTALQKLQPEERSLLRQLLDEIS